MGKNIVSREEIFVHLTDVEWLKEFISQYLTQRLERILKYYRYFSKGYCWPTELSDDITDVKEYYPEKGILLYDSKPRSYDPARGGTAFPSWGERADVYLLESGQIAIIQFRFYESSKGASIYDTDLSRETLTEMKLWTDDETQENKEEIANSLLKLLEKRGS